MKKVALTKHRFHPITKDPGLVIIAFLQFLRYSNIAWISKFDKQLRNGEMVRALEGNGPDLSLPFLFLCLPVPLKPLILVPSMKLQISF